MAKKDLSYLNEKLFDQIDKLSNSKLTGDDLDQEIERAKALKGLANPIVLTHKLVLEAVKLKALVNGKIPSTFGLNEKN